MLTLFAVGSLPDYAGAAPSPVSRAGTVRPDRPLDAQYAPPWHLHSVRAADAWRISRGAGVTVAVLDTGYAPLPGLAGRVVNGYDFVSDERKSGDGDGREPDAADTGATDYHASMVAGLIAGARGPDGLAGINPRARIVQVRVAENDGLVRVEDLVDAMRWSAGLPVAGVPANRHPARVLNLSLFADYVPLDGCDGRVQRALDELHAHGVIVVAGAGNDDADAGNYTPAGCRHVITVTATTRADRRAAYANYGGAVIIAAPGGERGAQLLVSTPRGQLQRTGTSLAAPLVSGVVSLMLGLNPDLTPAQVAQILVSTARPFPAGGCDASGVKSCGSGLLDAGKALFAARELRAGQTRPR